jgi:AmmeMemoRadiSam system protein A
MALAGRMHMMDRMTPPPEVAPILLQIARQAIVHALRPGGPAQSQVSAGQLAHPFLDERCGCFVSLHRMGTHDLRGCIGRMVSEDPLRQTLVEVAKGVLDDPRFADDPVTSSELRELELEITLLSQLHEARDPLDFDPAEQGIYLSVAGRRGCFLPQVARETGWDREQLLCRLCSEKMGLPPYAWQGEDVRLRTFTTTILGPEPVEPS